MIKKKVCMLGSFAVGKTSLVRRYVKGIFSDAYLTTVGVKISKKELRVDDNEVTLMLWDLYGEGALQKLRPSFLRGTSGFLLVVDGTRRTTLDQALVIIGEAEKTVGDGSTVIILNKCDLAEEWEIAPEKESALAGGRWKVVRTSAKTGEGVDKAFAMLARAILAK